MGFQYLWLIPAFGHLEQNLEVHDCSLSLSRGLSPHSPGRSGLVGPSCFFFPSLGHHPGSRPPSSLLPVGSLLWHVFWVGTCPARWIMVPLLRKPLGTTDGSSWWHAALTTTRCCPVVCMCSHSWCHNHMKWEPLFLFVPGLNHCPRSLSWKVSHFKLSLSDCKSHGFTLTYGEAPVSLYAHLLWGW